MWVVGGRSEFRVVGVAPVFRGPCTVHPAPIMQQPARIERAFGLEEYKRRNHMPIYEYKCMKCKKDFECLVFGNNGDICCPDCNSKKVKRLMSACSFKNEGNFSSSAASSGCSSCSGGSCSTCH